MYKKLIIIMMIVRPEGLWPSQRRKMELHRKDEPVEATVCD